MTDLFDATDIASCRMYQGMVETWNGFMKNATEGMASPVALPVWTVLLFGGQILPLGLLVYGSIAGMESPAWAATIAAVLFGYGLRTAFSLRFEQSWIGNILHPIGVLIVLLIQWVALGRQIFGLQTSWRGRV